MKKILFIILLPILLTISGCDPFIAEHGKQYLDLASYRFESVDNVKIAYREFGDESEPTLVMIHGFMGNTTNFEPILDELSKHFHLVLVDLPGFGLSDKEIEKPLSRRYMAQLVAGLLEKKKINRYHVLGHSMGSEVAAWIALEQPDRVASLILVSSSICIQGENRNFPDNVLVRIFLRLAFMNYHTVKNTFKDLLVVKDNFDETQFLKNYYLVYQTPMKVIFQLSKAADTDKLREKLSSIEVPTLVLWGLQDEVTPVDGARCLSQKIENCKVVLLENAGHLIMIDQPEKTSKAIEDFVLDVEKGLN